MMQHKIHLFSPVCLLDDRDKYGRPILLFRPGVVKPGIENLGQDIFTCIAIIMEALTEIEEFQIKGFVYIFDVSGLSLQHLGIVPIENWVKVGKNGEKGLAARHKAFHIVNVPAALTFVINIALKSMPEKLQERVKIYKSFNDLDFIDRKCLPKEYGGEKPMGEMFGKFKLNQEDFFNSFIYYFSSNYI